MSTKSWVRVVFIGLFAASLAFGQAASGPTLLTAGRKKVQEASKSAGGKADQALQDAMAIFQRVTTECPEDAPSLARAWLEIGRIQRRLGKAGEAKSAFEKAIALPGEERTLCDALLDLSTLARRAGRLEEAETHLRRIVEKHASQGSARAQALLKLGSVLKEARRDADAEACLRQCLADHGDRWRTAVDALDDLVMLKLRSEQMGEARKILEEHSAAMKARFAGTPTEPRLEKALQRMAGRGRIEREDGAPDEDDGK